MGFDGGSIHVASQPQQLVVEQIKVHLQEDGLVLVRDCPLPDIANRDRALFATDAHRGPYKDWSKPFKGRRLRAFLVTPLKGGWVSIFEYGEFYDRELAQALSRSLPGRVITALWVEAVGAQVFYSYANGELANHLDYQGHGLGFSSSGSLATATPDEFVLEEHVHDVLGVPLAYCFDFRYAFRDAGLWSDVIRLHELRFLRFERETDS
jgi:hypothetical protein